MKINWEFLQVSNDKKSGHLKKIVAYATIVGVLIALLGFLFGDGILSPKEPIVIVTDSQSTESPYTLIDDSILSKFTEEERDRYFPWVYIDRVVRLSAPTNTLSEKYEFVGLDWESDNKSALQIWNHFIRQPVAEHDANE